MMKHYMGCGSSILSYKKLTALIVFVGAIAVLIVAIPAFVSAAPGGSMQTATATLRTLNDSCARKPRRERLAVPFTQEMDEGFHASISTSHRAGSSAWQQR